MFGRIRLFFATLMIITVVIIPFVSRAATTVTDSFDQPTSLVVSESSNHKFSITVSGAVDEGDTLVLTFPSAFDTTGIVEDDIDVADDGVDLTTSSDCLGAEQASVVMSGDILTITVCAGDGGAIAGGSLVVIEIGTNASASGSGSGRIENPPTNGTYYVNINGTFGDYGSIPIPIISGVDGGEVSAVVSAPEEGGSGESGTTDTITVSTPNGGEDIESGSTYSITWSTTGSGITLVEIFYSLDGGSTYTSIISDETNDGSYSWSVPSVETTLAAIRIEGSDSSSVIDTDESDSVFTISVPTEADTIDIASPNGGESYEEGTSTAITWSSTGTGITLVNLYYSIDNGSSFSFIAGDESNDGSYTWTVPSVETSQALVRVVGTDGISTLDSDDSDLAFTITLIAEEVPVEEVPVEEPPVDEPPMTETPTTPPTETTPPTTPPTTTPTTPPTTTPTTTTPEESVPTPDRTIEPSISVDQGQITISPVEDIFSVLPGEDATVNFIVTDPGDITSVAVTYGDVTLTPISTVPGEYSVGLPVAASTEPLTIIVTYADGTVVTTINSVVIATEGMVYEVIEGVRTPISGAVVIIYTLDGGVRTQWDAGLYGIANPITTDDSGLIGWYVPNGTYVVTSGKNGYQDNEALRTVTNNILSPFIELKVVGEVIEPPVTEPETPGTIEQPTEPTVEAPSFYESITDSPIVQATADLAWPLAAVSAAVATAILASAFGLLPFLQYIFSAPILFFARRRRQTFGVIYNSYTKVPIDLAIVRLYSQAGKIVRTMVTDMDGRYFFKVDPGTYSIKVVKNGFTFPSGYVTGVSEDGKYLDIYTGGPILVETKDAIIAANIPIDPADQPVKQTAKYLKWHRALRVIQHLVAISGVIASLFVAIVQPGLLTIGLFILNLVIYLVTRFLVKPKKRKGWGIVYDEKSQKAVPNAVVRLFEPKYNKLIESTLTDSQGRYAFMVGANEYYTTYERGGFQKTEVRPIDYKNKVKPELVSIDVPLRSAV